MFKLLRVIIGLVALGAAFVAFAAAWISFTETNAREQGKLAAIAGGVPEAVAVESFRFPQDVRPAGEVHLRGQVDGAEDIRVTLAQPPVEPLDLARAWLTNTEEPVVGPHRVFTVYGASDDANTISAHAAILVPEPAVLAFLNGLIANGEGGGERGVLYSVNGQVADAGWQIEAARDALAAADVQVTEDFVLVLPWATERATALRPEGPGALMRPMMVGGAGVVALLLALLLFMVGGQSGRASRRTPKGKPEKEKPRKAAAPEPVASAPPKQRLRSFAIVVFGLCAITGVWYLRPEWTGLALLYGFAILMAVGLLTLIAGLFSRRASRPAPSAVTASDTEPEAAEPEKPVWTSSRRQAEEAAAERAARPRPERTPRKIEPAPPSEEKDADQEEEADTRPRERVVDLSLPTYAGAAKRVAPEGSDDAQSAPDESARASVVEALNAFTKGKGELGREEKAPQPAPRPTGKPAVTFAGMLSQRRAELKTAGPSENPQTEEASPQDDDQETDVPEDPDDEVERDDGIRPNRPLRAP